MRDILIVRLVRDLILSGLVGKILGALGILIFMAICIIERISSNECYGGSETINIQIPNSPKISNQPNLIRSNL